ncbi:DUF2304 domain-containing protein [Candidatus Falkowbacteria bacterium]|nr:DUF2304 domain-containing protein [Candidatus Falkowbacteria bacterium]
MSIFQIIIILLAAFMVIKAIYRLYKKEMTALFLILWICFWLVIALFDIYPAIIDWLAFKIGVGRGVDLLIYFSLIFIFYFGFRLWLKIKKIEKDITQIVQKTAINNMEKIDRRNEEDV